MTWIELYKLTKIAEAIYKKNFDAEGKFDARWDDKLKFFFKGPYKVWTKSGY